MLKKQINKNLVVKIKPENNLEKLKHTLSNCKIIIAK